MPTPRKNCVIVRTRSSVIRRRSRDSLPIEAHSSTRLICAGSSASSALTSSSRALSIESRRRPLSVSRDWTICCEFWKTSGIVFVVVWPMGGSRCSCDSNVASASDSSFWCSRWPSLCVDRRILLHAGVYVRSSACWVPLSWIGSSRAVEEAATSPLAKLL